MIPLAINIYLIDKTQLENGCLSASSNGQNIDASATETQLQDNAVEVFNEQPSSNT